MYFWATPYVWGCGCCYIFQSRYYSQNGIVDVTDKIVCISCSIVANLLEELQLLFELMQLKCNLNCFMPDLLSPLRGILTSSASPDRVVWEALLSVEEHCWYFRTGQLQYLANDISELLHKVSVNSYGISVYMRVSYLVSPDPRTPPVIEIYILAQSAYLPIDKTMYA